VLRIPTTRGDRLFISLLGAPSFISPGSGSSVPTLVGLGLSVVYAIGRVPLRLGGAPGSRSTLRPFETGRHNRPAIKPADNGRKKMRKSRILTTTRQALALLALGAGAASRAWTRPEMGRQRIPAFDALEGRAGKGDGVVHRMRRSLSPAWRSTSSPRPSRRMNMRRRTLAQGIHGDHRHQAHARPDPGRRRGRENPDADAVRPQPLRWLGQRFRSHRHPLPLQAGRNLTTGWRAKARTSPIRRSIINDFIGKSFTTAPDGKLYQLPDQQFANLYWFRYDWFKTQRT
jgi:hypothetical protein